jgi:hypothetical protein
MGNTVLHSSDESIRERMPAHPPPGPSGGAARAPERGSAVELARWLLAALGPPGAVALDPAPEPTSRAQDWADSGLASLAVADAPTAEPPTTATAVGAPATLARAAALAFTALTGVPLDGPALLGERAHSVGLRAQGTVSAGGGTRLVRAADGWWALNLARDLDLVPALVQVDLDATEAAAWTAVRAWSTGRSLAEILARARLLGLAAAGLGETPAPARPWRVDRRPASASRTPARPLVLGLGALWAGPLVGRLLAGAGARVIHVESRTRPDPTRESTPDFYRRLRAGQEIRTLDFARPTELIELLRAADVVIEASRPRALRALGADADTIMCDGRARTWLRITGYPDGDRVGFGDDAAVAGGLVGYTDAGPVFAGDAIADPLTGLLGALAIVGHRHPADQVVIDINLAETAALAAGL